LPAREPLPQAAVAESMTALLDRLEDRIMHVRQSRHRLELAFLAMLVGGQGTLNFLHNAVGKLSVEDWQSFPDLAIDLRRQARELSERLDPVCAALEKTKQSAERRLAAVG
jgi:dihydrodipicolinate synthase/N-acetylneuraminate lyase